MIILTELARSYVVTRKHVRSSSHGLALAKFLEQPNLNRLDFADWIYTILRNHVLLHYMLLACLSLISLETPTVVLSLQKFNTLIELLRNSQCFRYLYRILCRINKKNRKSSKFARNYFITCYINILLWLNFLFLILMKSSVSLVDL